ncbi:hypothetical protein MNB_SM-7-176 [hydrothermal vent metagenome]|uniref:Uncharacterized protein n=1 Tax=hydrothermal vent metagenome TaxID=652676 RepID=A0A1W1BM82_9ZZZZ
MKNLGFILKYKFFNAFREIFVHHYNSLDFRAKIFALMIAANQNPKVENFILVKEIADKIYKDDEDRANLLMLTTKEFVNRVLHSHTYTSDKLIDSIINNLKHVPRYAKKIDIEALSRFLDLSEDEDTFAYQKNILEFLQKLKAETLKQNIVETSSTEFGSKEKEANKLPT